MKKPLTLSERLKVCQTCKNCKRDIDRGLICALTDEKPDFEESCDKYESDGKAEIRQRYRAEADKRIGRKWWLAAIPFIIITTARFAVKCSVKSATDSIADKQVQEYIQKNVDQLGQSYGASATKLSAKTKLNDPVKYQFGSFEGRIEECYKTYENLEQQYGEEIDYWPWYAQQEFVVMFFELIGDLSSWVTSLSEEESDRLCSEIIPNSQSDEVKEFFLELGFLYLESLQ